MPQVDVGLIRDVALGIALAAACGLRIFLPMLVMSIAALAGRVDLGPGVAWIGTWPALTIFGVATLVEIAAYHVPWLDNLLDALGAPVAVTAGTLLMASVLPADEPVVRWVVAVIAGGGMAGAVHGSLAVVRKLSSLTTGGLANPLIGIAEAVGAVLLSVVALLLPLLALAAAIILLAIAVRLYNRGRRRTQSA